MMVLPAVVLADATECEFNGYYWNDTPEALRTHKTGDGNSWSPSPMGSAAFAYYYPFDFASYPTGSDTQMVYVSASSPYDVEWRQWNGSSWSSATNVESAAGSIAPGGISTAFVGTTLHVCAIDSSGNPVHAIRTSGGSWTSWGSVEGQAGTVDSLSEVACVGIGTDLHYVVRTVWGQIYHTLRSTSSWTSFGQVWNPGSSDNNATGVDITSDGTDMHIALITNGGDRIWHVIRYSSNGSWSSWVDIESQSGSIDDIYAVHAGKCFGNIYVLAAKDYGSATIQWTRKTSSAWSSSWSNMPSPQGVGIWSYFSVDARAP